MAVLIKGMEMPYNCWDCSLLNASSCPCKNYSSALEYTTNRHPNCPLIEIPEPHGRLIDADGISEHKYATIPPYRKEYADGKPKSKDEIIAFKFGWNNAIDAIVENAPTIIPASEEE